MKLFRPQHFEIVSEDLIKQYLKIAFWVSPFAFWKLYELISKVL